MSKYIKEKECNMKLKELKNQFKDKDIANQYYRILVEYDNSKDSYKKYAHGMAWCNILGNFSCLVYPILVIVIVLSNIYQAYQSSSFLDVRVIVSCVLCFVGMIIHKSIFMKISEFLESKIIINKLSLNKEDIEYLNFLLKQKYEDYSISKIETIDNKTYVYLNYHMHDVTELLNTNKKTLKLRKYYEIEIVDTTVIINNKIYKRNGININYVSEITNE